MLQQVFKSCYLLVFTILMLLSRHGNALSRRTKQQTAELQAQMIRAEEAYRLALVGVNHAEPQATANADKALEDMEDVIIACANLRHCTMGTLLTSYKRLLKMQIDTLASDDPEPIAKDGLQIDRSMALEDPAQRHQRQVSLFADDPAASRFMVTYNEAVQVGMRRWLTDLRPQLFASYENYMNLRNIMWPEWQHRGLPEALLFGIIAKESSGRAHINSRTGAVGLMQFMPATGRRFGLGYDTTGFDSRLDAQRVAAASADFLSERLAELNGNIELSLAGYNGGEGRAVRVFTQSHGGNFWDAPVYALFPAETQDYVPMVIAAALIFLHPDQYGVDFPAMKMQPGELVLQHSATLYELAMCLGNQGTRDGYFRALRNLNPRLDPDQWIASGTRLQATQRMSRVYRRYCLAGSRAEMARALSTARLTAAVMGVASDVVQSTAARSIVPTASTMRPMRSDRLGHNARPSRRSVYVVVAGQTLREIAERHRCLLKSLARANRLSPPLYRIHSGQMLTLAGCRGRQSQ